MSRIVNLSTIRNDFYDNWQSNWFEKEFYSQIIFDDLNLKIYLTGIFYRLRMPTDTFKITYTNKSIFLVELSFYLLKFLKKSRVKYIFIEQLVYYSYIMKMNLYLYDYIIYNSFNYLEIKKNNFLITHTTCASIQFIASGLMTQFLNIHSYHNNNNQIHKKNLKNTLIDYFKFFKINLNYKKKNFLYDYFEFLLIIKNNFMSSKKNYFFLNAYFHLKQNSRRINILSYIITFYNLYLGNYWNELNVSINSSSLFISEFFYKFTIFLNFYFKNYTFLFARFFMNFSIIFKIINLFFSNKMFNSFFYLFNTYKRNIFIDRTVNFSLLKKNSFQLIKYNIANFLLFNYILNINYFNYFFF